MNGLYPVFAVIVVVVAVILFSSLKILREYQRGVIFIFGRFQAVKGPGIIVLIPIAQQMVRIDLRTVTLDVPPQIPVSGSAGQMQQVLVNLVQNAIDSTERQPDACLDIQGEVRSRSVVLTFRDNGPGFPEESLDKAFDPFFTTKPVGKGTGLGLAISYGIVERHRGQLKASNHPGGGAVLTLTLPLAG